MSRYQVGDYVLLVQQDAMENVFDTVDDMLPFAGYCCQVTEIEDEDSEYYRLTANPPGVEPFWWHVDHIDHNATERAEFPENAAPRAIPRVTTRQYSCRRCGASFRAEPPLPDGQLCPRCEKRDYLLPYHNFAPRLEFYGSSTKGTPLFMGVELEVAHGNGEPNNDVKSIMPLINKGIDDGKFFAYCASDSSLTNGIEIITQPATLRSHKKRLPQYEDMFEKLIELGYRSHNSPCCGIHVHVNRDFFDGEDKKAAMKITRIFERFWNDIVVFSRRDKHKGLHRFCKKPNQPPRAFVESWDKSGEHDSHYYALNFGNANTIEFRIFRGTLNSNTFVAILDFVDTICRIAKSKTVADIELLTFEDLLTVHAASYFANRKRQLRFEEV